MQIFSKKSKIVIGESLKAEELGLEIRVENQYSILKG